MPSIQKALLGGYTTSPHTVSIPKSSRDSKTLVKTDSTLFMFQDSSKAHSEYLMAVLPQIFLKNWTPDMYVKWFRDLPANSYIEVDLTKKMCYLCSIV